MALRQTQVVIEMSTKILAGALKRERRLKLTTSPPSMSRMSRKVWILDVSQLSRTQWVDTGIGLLYLPDLSRIILISRFSLCITKFKLLLMGAEHTAYISNLTEVIFTVSQDRIIRLAASVLIAQRSRQMQKEG